MAKVELPLIRKRDKKPVGTLTLIRTPHTFLYDGEGRRLATPKPVDTLIISLRNPAGEEITVLTVPMAELEGPVVVEPPDPNDPDELAFQAELRGNGER